MAGWIAHHLLLFHVLLLLFAASQTTSTPPAPPPPSSSSSTSSSYSTNIFPVIDPRLTLVLSPAGSELLRARAVHMDIVQAMASMALMNPDAIMPPHYEYVVPNMQDVTISIISRRRSSSMTTKHALWGLCLVGAAMALDEDVSYRNRIFTVKWQGTLMGRILVFRAKIPPEPSEGEQPLRTVDDGDDDRSGTLNAAASEANQNDRNLQSPALDIAGLQTDRSGSSLSFQTDPSTELRVKYMPDYKHPATLAQIFIPLQNALVECASKSRHARVEQSITFCSSDVDICFDYGDYPGSLTREQSFWTYGEAVLGLAMVARIATGQNNGRGPLTEVTWMVERNGVAVGLGSIFTNPEFASLQGSLDELNKDP